MSREADQAIPQERHPLGWHQPAIFRHCLTHRNCQVDVFLGYASPLGKVLINQRLYLLQDWTKDPPRWRLAGVPARIAFVTKTEIARELIGNVLDAGAPCA